MLFSENQGDLLVPLRNVAELAPVAQVVVYAIMPSGVMVADSVDFPIQPCLKNKVGLSQSLPVHVGLALLHIWSQTHSACVVYF